MLEVVTVSLTAERRVSRPWGSPAGAGSAREIWLLRGGNESLGERLSAKVTLKLKAGDVLWVLTPGGAMGMVG
jgi:N-methylhydantoinase B/oxoprolinase/acetone carboxylase alpha subunit